MGIALARACAGYFHQKLVTVLDKKGEARIGIGHGFMPYNVINELEKMKIEGLIQKPHPQAGKIIWYPLIASFPFVEPHQDAQRIAIKFENFYGLEGEIKHFDTHGIVHSSLLDTVDIDTVGNDRNITRQDKDIVKELAKTDIVLVGATTLKKQIDKVKYFIQEQEPLKKILRDLEIDRGHVISTIILDEKGNNKNIGISAIGIRFEELEEAKENGAVILACGGEEHRDSAYSALKGELISVLITTIETAKFLVKKSEEKG